MQYPVFAEVIPQMLAHSHHLHELSPVQHIRIDKPPLRPIHPHSLPRKRRRMSLRPAMYLIAFRHGSVPHRAGLDSLDTKHLVRLGLLHPRHERIRLRAAAEEAPVVEPARAQSIALPNHFTGVPARPAEVPLHYRRQHLIVGKLPVFPLELVPVVRHGRHLATP